MRVLRLLPLVLVLLCFSCALVEQAAGQGLSAPDLLDADLTSDGKGGPVLRVEIPQDFGVSTSPQTGEPAVWSIVYPVSLGVGPGGKAEMQLPAPASGNDAKRVLLMPLSWLPRAGLIQGLIVKADQNSREIEEFYVIEKAETGGGDDTVEPTLLFIVVAIVLALLSLLLIWIRLRRPWIFGWFGLPADGEKEAGSGSGPPQNPVNQLGPPVKYGLVEAGQIQNLEKLLKDLDYRVIVGVDRISGLINSHPGLKPSEQMMAILEQFRVSSSQLTNFESEFGKEIREIIRGELRGVASAPAAAPFQGVDREFSRQWLENMLRDRLGDLGRSAELPFRKSKLSEESQKTVIPADAQAASSGDAETPAKKPGGAAGSEALAKKFSETKVIASDFATWTVRIGEANPFNYVQALKELHTALSLKEANQGYRIWFARISQASSAQGWLMQEVLAVEDGSPRFCSLQGVAIISLDVWQVMLAISEEGTGRQPESVALLFSWSRLEKGAPAISRYLADWPSSTLRPELVRCTRPAVLEWSDQASGYIVSKKLGVAPIDREMGGFGGQ